MSEFMEWLNNEIANLESVNDESAPFVWGKFSEAVRIRAKICELDAKDAEKGLLRETINEVCDKVCKYSTMYPFNKSTHKWCADCNVRRLKEKVE